MEVGRRYLGYGYINEYGQFDFTPQQKGSQAGREKVVFTDSDYTISTTKNYVLIKMRIPKGGNCSTIPTLFINRFNKILKKLMNYDF